MQSAEKFSIAMTPNMLRAARESVEAGGYAPTGKALRDAVRVWRSLDDPRPSLGADEAEARMTRFFVQEAKDRDDAAA